MASGTGRVIGLVRRWIMRANRVGSCGDDDRIALARVLIVVEPGRNVFAPIGDKLL